MGYFTICGGAEVCGFFRNVGYYFGALVGIAVFEKYFGYNLCSRSSAFKMVAIKQNTRLYSSVYLHSFYNSLRMEGYQCTASTVLFCEIEVLRAKESPLTRRKTGVISE